MNQNNTVGPGAIEEQGTAPKPLLDGASEWEYVTVFNPLPMDFVGQVGQSKLINLPFEVRKDGFTQTISNDESSVRQNYGLNLKNPDHQQNQARLPIVNKIVIPAGKTLNILGNEAQVIVRQLVTEVLQREGKRLMLADPFQRREVEQRVVRGRRSVQEALGDVPQSVQSQLREGVDKLNEQEYEEEFPALRSNDSTGQITEGSGGSGSEVIPRKRGIRGRKARTAETTA